MADIVKLNRKPLPEEEDLTIEEYFKLHPDVMAENEARWEAEFDELAELGKEDPELSDYTKLKEIQETRKFINKPYDEMNEFEKKITEKNTEELKRIVQRI